MAYEYFYGGTPYTLEPGYNKNIVTGYTERLGALGLTTDPRTANKLQDVSNKLNTGLKVMEISAVSPEIFESIPQQHLTEIKRLSKLTGSETTLHAPIVEASGFGREGWSESHRRAAESQISMAVERAHELDPNGNMPVTFHSSAQLPEALERIKEKVGGEMVEKEKAMWIINPESGRTHELKEIKRHFPGEPETFNPTAELEKINKESWVQNVGNIGVSAIRAMDVMDRAESIVEKSIQERVIKGEINDKEVDEERHKLFEGYALSRSKEGQFEKLSDTEKKLAENVYRDLDYASVVLKESYSSLKNLFNTAMNNPKLSEEDKAKLKSYAEEVKNRFAEGVSEENKAKLQEFAKLIEDGMKVLDNVTPPTSFVPLNDFMIEQSSKTFGGAAFNAFQKFGDKAPIVSIENPLAGMGISRAEDLKKLVVAAREQFVEKAKKEGISESEAKSAAEKLIGATWDVGHINMIRKFGYDKNDLIKEAEKIAPYVKHVHLSDNFGHEHTELPMGMGNVPIKEIMEKLGKEGFEGKKIIEAGNWWSQFRTAPVMQTLEALGSPIYPMMASPSWTQMSSTYGSYFQFPSGYFPEQHFSLYGGGFSGLPQELGGQIPGKQSRMSGTPME